MKTGIKLQFNITKSCLIFWKQMYYCKFTIVTIKDKYYKKRQVNLLRNF